MPRNLLLADDSITIQKVVGIIFAGEDFNIVTVDNGEDALARARELQPDIILADVVMPRRNGYELCEAIKSDPSLKQIPVLLLAGTFEAFDEARARAVRADAHIAKPFESQALINKVKELIARAGAPDHAPAAQLESPAVSRPTLVVPPASTPVNPRPTVVVPPAVRPPPAAPPVLRSPVAAVRPPSLPPPIVPRPSPWGAPRARPPATPVTPVMPARAPVPVVAPSPQERTAAPPPPEPPRGAATRPPVELDWSDLGFSDPAPTQGPQESPEARVARPVAPVAAAPISTPEPWTAPPVLLGDDRPTPGDRRADGAALLAVDDDEPLPLGEPIDLAELQSDGPIDEPGSDEPSAPRPAEAKAGAWQDGGEAQLREALSRASREVIERIAWEIVPALAETIIREHIERLAKERQR
jgi:CheY-like chemotaxis protein